jgi:hypothetical protein
VPAVRATLRGRFLFPAKLKLAVTKGYPVEPVDGYSTRPVPPDKYAHEWTLAATPATPAVSEDFLTALQIQRLAPPAGPQAQIETMAATNAFGVRIASGEEVHIILFRRRDAAGAMSGGGLESDGIAVAVRLVAGGVRSAFAAGATRLRLEGAELLREKTPVDWSLSVTPQGRRMETRADTSRCP